MDDWVFIAGGRFDNVKSQVDTTTMVSSGVETESNTTSKFSYRVGALYQFESGVSPFCQFCN
ncbi:TonB-dependent receptor [Vibrio sp. PP-XX7]